MPSYILYLLKNSNLKKYKIFILVYIIIIFLFINIQFTFQNTNQINKKINNEDLNYNENLNYIKKLKCFGSPSPFVMHLVRIRFLLLSGTSKC